MLLLLRLERKQKKSSNPFRIRIFLFLSYSFEMETINTFIHSRSSFENRTPIPDQNGPSVYPFSDQNGAKTPPGGGGTYLYTLYKGVPPPGGMKRKNNALHCSKLNLKSQESITWVLLYDFCIANKMKTFWQTWNTLTEIESKTRTQKRFGQRLAWVLLNLGEMCARRFSKPYPIM